MPGLPREAASEGTPDQVGDLWRSAQGETEAPEAADRPPHKPVALHLMRTSADQTPVCSHLSAAYLHI